MNRKLIFVIFTLPMWFTSLTSVAQKLRYGVHVSYSSVKYSFPGEKPYTKPYADIKTNAFPSVGIGASLYLQFSESVRFGSGLQYNKISGEFGPEHIEVPSLNSNYTGDMTIEVDNSYIMIPIEFVCILSRKLKVQPFLAGGLSFPIASSHQIVLNVVPDEPDPGEEMYHNEIAKDQVDEPRGAVIGVGAIVPFKNSSELMFRLNYRPNSNIYVGTVANGAPENRKLKFNMLEFSIGFSMQSPRK